MTITAAEREAMRRTSEQERVVEAALKVTRDDIVDVLAFMGAEDLADRCAALAGVVPDVDRRRALIAAQNIEVLEQLVTRIPAAYKAVEP